MQASGSNDAITVPSSRAPVPHSLERFGHPALPPTRGAASLIVVMGLLLVLSIGAAYAGRSLLLEQKASAAQYHGTQAFEAAEAGLEWTLAQLNGGRIDAQCRPSGDATDASLRERGLRVADAAIGSFMATPPAASVGSPSCLRGGDGAWLCSCPAGGSGHPSVGPTGVVQPAFRVELAGAAPAGGSTSYPGVVQLRSHGCIDSRGTGSLCSDGDGVMVVSEQAALLPALANLPVATLSAEGRVDATGAAIGLHNDQPGGLLVDAGADAALGDAQLSTAPGASADNAVLAQDEAQAATRASARFLSLFGVPSSAYAQLPAVVTLHCPLDCSDTLRAALAQGARMLWIDNDLAVSNLEIGSADAPVLIVSAGALRFDGNVRCTGMVYGSGWQWRNGQTGQAWLHGAAVIAGDVQLQDAVDLAYDAAALGILHHLTGSFVRVPGSWTDQSS